MPPYFSWGDNVLHKYDAGLKCRGSYPHVFLEIKFILKYLIGNVFALIDIHLQTLVLDISSVMGCSWKQLMHG